MRKPSQTIPRNLGGRGARQAEQRLALAAETVKTADQQRDLERQRAEELDRLLTAALKNKDRLRLPVEADPEVGPGALRMTNH